MLNDLKEWWSDMDPVTRRKIRRLSKIVTVIAVIILAPTLIINVLALALTGVAVIIVASPILIIVAGLCGLAALIWKLL